MQTKRLIKGEMIENDWDAIPVKDHAAAMKDACTRYSVSLRSLDAYATAHYFRAAH